MSSRDSDFRNARVDSYNHMINVLTETANRELYTVLQGGGRYKVHLSENACTCETTTHSFTYTITLIQMNFAPFGLLYYTTVQYEAFYCRDIFAWKLNSESRLMSQSRDF